MKPSFNQVAQRLRKTPIFSIFRKIEKSRSFPISGISLRLQFYIEPVARALAVRCEVAGSLMHIVRRESRERR